MALFGDHKPADTLVGVEALSPGYLIEVEAIAVVDGYCSHVPALRLSP